MNSRLQFLHLEDDPHDAELVRSMLHESGVACDITRVQTREEFLGALKGGKFHVILSDFSIPGFDGKSALELARQYTPEVPFIFVSGTIGEDAAIEAMLGGAADYVLKTKMSRFYPAIGRVLRESAERENRKLVEKELHKFKLAIEQTEDIIVITDKDGFIEYVNPAYEKVTGYRADEVIGKTPRIIKSGHHDKSVYDSLWKTLRTGRTFHVEFINKKKSGDLFYEQQTISPILDENGVITHFISTGKDLTERKKLEAHLFRSQRLESLGTLASGIAHDLNNVLSPIVMAVEILKEKETDELSKTVLATVESSAARGADIVKQVLAFVRGTEGAKNKLHMKHVLREIETIAKETFPKSIQSSFSIPPSLRLIEGDATQLHQVLLNICVNARDAMPNGGRLTIAAENVDLDEAYVRLHADARVGPYVAVSLTDTGMGIPPDILSKIFDPFFTTKEVGKGTGLGLSTTLNIVKSHGGFINVYSEPGKGTKFKIYLPAIATTQEREAAQKQRELPAGNGELILVVDDEASIREITKATLESYGYKTLIGTDGTEAVALFLQHRYDIKTIMTDMSMPFLDGPATIRALRNIDTNVKIIAMSGLPGDESVVNSSETKVQGFLSKPYTAEQLLTKLSSVLKQ